MSAPRTTPAAPATAQFATEDSTLRIRIEGAMVLDAVVALRAEISREIESRKPRKVLLDLAAVTRADASGVSVAVFAERFCDVHGAEFAVVGATGDTQLIVELALRGQHVAPPVRGIGQVREIGRRALELVHVFTELTRFIGEISLEAVRMLRHPQSLRVRDSLAAAERHGADAVPVVGLLGFLIGAIIAFQTYDPLKAYGATKQVADVVGISMVRELGPLIACIILAGRTASAFAAEIGTMKVTQELDALRTFGIDPVRFLVIPRMLAVVLVTPFLSVWCTVLGIVGGYVILGPKGFTLIEYLTQVRDAVDLAGYLQGLVKSAVFAVLVSSIGCLSGLHTHEGPGSVGVSTTRAVVVSIIAIIAADAALGFFFYTLGI